MLPFYSKFYLRLGGKSLTAGWWSHIYVLQLADATSFFFISSKLYCYFKILCKWKRERSLKGKLHVRSLCGFQIWDIALKVNVDLTLNYQTVMWGHGVNNVFYWANTPKVNINDSKDKYIMHSLLNSHWSANMSHVIFLSLHCLSVNPHSLYSTIC